MRDCGEGGGVRVPRVQRVVDEVVAGLLGPVLRLEVPSRTGWQLVSWDAEQGVNLTLARGDTLVLIELGPRDERSPCHAATARFNVYARHPFDPRAPLSVRERAAVDQLVALLREREARLPVIERPSVTRRSAVREIEVERVLMAEGAGHYYINPYVGCMIGCEFCYVAGRADLSRALEGLPRLAWGRYVDVKVNAAEVLRREVTRHPPGIVRLSPILTDPYQPLERHYRVTRACLEVLLDARFTPVILTRAAAVLDDLDLLRRFPRAAVGFSVPSDEDRMRRAFEPGADPVEARFEALARCHEAGVTTFAVIQPMLPMNAPRLVELLAPHVQAVRLDRMHEIEKVRHLYDAAGVLAASGDEFFRETEAALRRELAARGVPIDEMDDMGGLVGGAAAPRANSFNFEPVQDLGPWGGACPVAERPGPWRDRRRSALIAEAGRLCLCRTDTRDFSEATLARTVHELGQLYLLVAAKAAPDDFPNDLRQLRRSGRCAACPSRDRCCGCFEPVAEDVFTRDDRRVRELIVALRGRVLDVGCGGDARYADVLEPLVRGGAIEYHGLDPDPAAVASLRARGWAQVDTGSLEELDSPPAAWDHLLLLRAFNHLRDVPRALAAAGRALRPGGELLVVDNVAFGLVRLQPPPTSVGAPPVHEHYRNADSDEAIALVTPHGFRLVEHQPVRPGGSDQWLARFVRAGA